MTNIAGAASLDKIWEKDLLDRRTEAELLIDYIESVVTRHIGREDQRAYTIAVDASYGEGKTFFLTRLARHLAINHPVAFVDAWADDLANQPLTALVATLQCSLKPLLKESKDIRDRMNSVLKTTGKIAKIAAVGLLKRGIGFAITSVATEAIADTISEASVEVQKSAQKGLADASREFVDEAPKAIDSIASEQFMGEQIAAFQSGQLAIQELKESLSTLLNSLGCEPNSYC